MTGPRDCLFASAPGARGRDAGRVACTLLLLSLVVATALTAQDSTGAGSGGRIAGRVVDRETGRPLPSANVQVTNAGRTATTDLDGRYRIGPVAPGVYTVRAALIGYQPVVVDSVKVVEGQTALADFALTAVPFEMAAVTVEAAPVPQASSDAGLLTMQQAAPAVSDGVSAEGMKRTPDARAADAIARVPGISIFDGKFVIVRGLPERYSNTLLNGAELVSTEPVKRIVPLDIFPSSLLESIVTTKTATPDRPGDFAGGSVAITTKEFPEQFVFQLSTSQGYNSEATFRSVPLVPWSFSDFFGFDDGRRSFPVGAPAIGAFGSERFAESIRNVWTPAARGVTPDMGLGLSLGGQTALGGAPLGYILSWTYSNKTAYNPDRLYNLYPDANTPAFRSLRFTESHAGVDWGALFNLSTRLGPSTKLGWKNLYTRQAQEDVFQSAGYEIVNNRTTEAYQLRYTTEHLLQTQLTGDHQLPWLLGSRIEWKGTLAIAGREEPDNRQAVYSGGVLSIGYDNPQLWTRFLDDELHALQLDWSIPMNFRQSGDALVKVGGLYRRRARDFDSRLFWFQPTTAPGAINDSALALPPEQAFAPENIGRIMTLYSPGGHAEPYGADDDVNAGYLMLDLPVLRALRLVGGLRVEDWSLDIFPGGREAVSLSPASRHNTDLLWSANATVRLSARMNLRFAGFRTVARPDAREVTANAYQGVVGECAYVGSDSLVRTWIMNGDARWELYPRPGEVVALSGFYKRFNQPIVETSRYPDGLSCLVTYRNAASAEDYGVEVELRKTLDFLPGLLGHLAISANVTHVTSRVAIGAALGNFDPNLPLQGQSPWLANGTLSYGDAHANAGVSVNFFSDRVVRYGFSSEASPVQAPNLIENGRATIDAKAQLTLRSHLTLTVAGRNLTDQPIQFIHHAQAGTVVAQFVRPGVSANIGVGYAF
jgi:hypothetical protein